MKDQECPDDLALLAQEVARLAREGRSRAAPGKPFAWAFKPTEVGHVARVLGRRGAYIVTLDEGSCRIKQIRWRTDYGVELPESLRVPRPWDQGLVPCVNALVRLEVAFGPLAWFGDLEAEALDSRGWSEYWQWCDDEACDGWLEQERGDGWVWEEYAEVSERQDAHGA